MKKSVLYLCFWMMVFAQGLNAESNNAEKLWFPVGEQLIHKIYWGFIPVGNSVTSTSWIEADGKKLLHIRVRTKTTKLFDKIRKVDDLVESKVDPDTFLPLSFRRKMTRRKQSCDEVTMFDYSKLEGAWQDRCSNRKKSFSIEPGTKDILTYLYFMRQSKLEAKSEYNYRVMADEGMFSVKVKTKKKKTIKLPFYGGVESLQMDPVFDFDGLLVAGGKFRLWVSDDDRRILTKIQIKRKLADIRIVLQRVAGPGDDSWIKPGCSENPSLCIMSEDQVEQFLSGKDIKSFPQQL
jgi:hypothetical protein